MEEQTRTPAKKRSRLFGLVAFFSAFIALCILIVAAANALMGLMKGEMTAVDIDIVTVGSLVAGILAIAGLILAIVTFFLRKQKNGFAACAVALSVLVLLLSGAVTYFYNYMFGTLNYDDSFDNLDKEELLIVEPEEDGRVTFETQAPAETLSQEEIEEKISLHQVEWEYLVNEDIPEAALEKMNETERVNECYLLEGSEKITNYLLFGLDQQGSSDSIMIVSMDRVHKKLKLISLARDSYVKIPEWGTYTKLTYAYNAGGARTAVSTVNMNYFLNISEYISVDMEQIVNIVDYVGGVTVELDSSEVNHLSKRKYYGLTVGANHLDGKTALAYARIRSSSSNDSEAKRTGRQREVLQSLYESALDMSVTEYPELVRNCMEMCTTSFGSSELLGLASEALTNGYEIEQYALIDMIDYWGGTIGKENYFYVVYDLDHASDILYRLIYEDLYISGYPDNENPNET